MLSLTNNFKMGKSFSIPNKWLSFFLHAIGWIIVIIIPLYLNSVYGDGNQNRLYQFYVHTFSAMVLFYLGYWWLVPRFFLRERVLFYLILLAVFIAATYFMINFINETFLFDPVQEAKFQEAMRKIAEGNEHRRPPIKAFGVYNHILASLLISGFAMGLGVMEKLKQNEKKQKELEKEKLNSELAFLKNQVSPHFFFNTLNNIYSLIGIDTAEAQESVLKLSKLMRYLLYESEHGETPISHEIDFMNNYIDLMKLRLSPKVDLQVNFPKNFSDFTIPPLLFIPFVENAFKHGVSHREHSFIHLSMQIEGARILFSAHNSVGKSSQPVDLQHSGIGLENVKKRLMLLFPETHTLDISRAEHSFSVELTVYKPNPTP